MRRSPFQPARDARRCLAALAVLAAVLLSGLHAPAQQPDKPQLFFSDDAAGLKGAVRELRLRPNQPREVFLHVRGDKGAAGMKVELLASGQPVATAPAALPAKGGISHVIFGKATPPKDPKAPPLPLTAASGPLSVRLLDADGKQLDAVDIGVARPKEYVKVESVSFDPTVGEDGKKNVLEIKLVALPTFSGTKPAAVELLLPPKRIPALVPGQRPAGSYAGTLSPGGSVTLRAEDLSFRETPTLTQGLFYVTVDGYPRAFSFVSTFTGEKTKSQPREPTGRVMRLVHAPFARPGAKFPVTVEVDNSPADSVCSLGLFRDFVEGKGVKGPEGEPKRFAGDRQEQLLFTSAGPNGALVFEPKVQDWTFEFETKKVYGVRYLAAEMLDAAREKMKDPEAVLPVLDSKEIPTDVALEKTRRRIVEKVLLYEGGPDDITLDVNIPEPPKTGPLPELALGAPLPLKAVSADPTGVTKAVFFTGVPMADGKIPPTALTADGDPLPGDAKTWVAELKVPTERKSLVTVSVQVTNGAGQTSVKTIKVQLVDPKAPPAAKVGPKVATITGRVLEGGRAMPGVPLALRDDKGFLKAAAKTDAKGEYKFEKVPPGAYSVNAVRTVSRTRGQTLVSVPEGKELIENVDVKLLR